MNTDVIGVLTETDRLRKYWSDLKAKLQKEGNELSEKIGQLKLKFSNLYGSLCLLRGSLCYNLLYRVAKRKNTKFHGESSCYIYL